GFLWGGEIPTLWGFFSGGGPKGTPALLGGWEALGGRAGLFSARAGARALPPATQTPDPAPRAGAPHSFWGVWLVQPGTSFAATYSKQESRKSASALP